MGASESSGRSNGTEKEKEEQRKRNSSGSSTETAVAIAMVAAGVAVTAWGISKMLSDDTDTQERDDAIMIKPRGEEQSPSIRRFSHPPDRFRSINTYHSIKGESSRGICIEDDDHVQVRKQGNMWLPPPRGCFKMNTDGACRPNPGGLGGYGGILRNDNGDFVCGFYGFIGATDGLTAEFHGILKGLQVLVKRGYTGLILETDCQAAHEWVTEKTRDRPSNSEIISNCWNIITECRDLAEFYKIDIKIIVGKHANRCADKLAAMALKEQDKYVEIKHVPDEIKSFVDNDKKKSLMVELL